MPGGNGSLWRRALLGPRDRQARPRSAADEPALRQAIRKSQKNDGNDAEAICEAAGRPSMRFVPVKSESQQDVQALHRIRFQLIKWRTALANEIRGLLGEYGIVVAKGIAPLRRELPRLLDDGEIQLSGLFREMLGEMAERLKLLDQRIHAV